VRQMDSEPQYALVQHLSWLRPTYLSLIRIPFLEKGNFPWHIVGRKSDRGSRIESATKRPG
jgi:hypothetical protein